MSAETANDGKNVVLSLEEAEALLVSLREAEASVEAMKASLRASGRLLDQALARQSNLNEGLRPFEAIFRLAKHQPHLPLTQTPAPSQEPR